MLKYPRTDVNLKCSFFLSAILTLRDLNNCNLHEKLHPTVEGAGLGRH